MNTIYAARPVSQPEDSPSHHFELLHASLPTGTQFGDWLRNLRVELGMSQTALAVSLGTHQSVISRLERADWRQLKVLLKGELLEEIFLFSRLTANEFFEQTGVYIPTTTLLHLWHEEQPVEERTPWWRRLLWFVQDHLWPSY